MPDFNLTQSEADSLIAMAKTRLNDDEWDYPGMGGSISIPLTSLDKRENFSLDVSRGRIDLSKGKYQHRARQIVILVRLDFGGPPHRNPDGEEIVCPHLHIYREGHGDKWAVGIPAKSFSNPSDLWQTFEEFMRFCNIVEPPIFKRGLFT